MSIDYDRLRELVAEMEQGTAATTRYTWLDLAHELLRLRDGVEDVLAQMLHHATLLRDWEQHNLAFHLEQYAHRLNRILEGDWKH
mgnify:FL=1